MPTQDEIEKLARVYAEDATKADAGNPNLSASDLNGIKRDVAEYAEEVISWLLRTHCIVSKEKVNEEYKSACKSVNKHSATTGCLFFVGQKQVLESLFDAETFKNSEL